MRTEFKLGSFSRLFLLAGIADILSSLGGFLFGSVLILAAAALLIRRYRQAGAILGPISMAIAAFLSLRTVIALAFPPPPYYMSGNLIYGSAQALLMSPSPIFSFLLSGPSIITGTYSQVMAAIDLGFNIAAVTLNFLGLGFSILGWTTLLGPDSTSAGAGVQNLPTSNPLK